MRSLRRVLIVQPYGIGDLLFLTPIFRALRLIPTLEKVDLLLGSRTEAVVRGNPHVDEVFSIDKDLFHKQNALQNLSEMSKLGIRLRENHYDLMLDYSLRGEYAFWGRFVLGISRCAGFNYKRRGFFHNIRFSLPEAYKEYHVVDYACNLAEKAGVRVESRFLEFYLSPSEKEEARQTLSALFGETQDGFIVVSPGGGESWGKDAHFKQWPAAHFAKLVEKIKEQSGIDKVLILGSSGEATLGKGLKQQLKGEVADLSGKTSLRQTAALIEKASCFIGNDGGLVHLSHALRIPVIAFYGPVDPKVYGPYPPADRAIPVFKAGLDCRPCYQKFRYKSDCSHRDCLQDLQVEEVWQFIKPILEKSPRFFVSASV